MSVGPGRIRGSGCPTRRHARFGHVLLTADTRSHGSHGLNQKLLKEFRAGEIPPSPWVAPRTNSFVPGRGPRVTKHVIRVANEANRHSITFTRFITAQRDTGCTRACCAGGGPPGTRSLSERCASAEALAWRASGALLSAPALLMQDTWTARRGYTPELNGQVGVACPRRQGTALPGPGWTRASHVQCACVRLD